MGSPDKISEPINVVNVGVCHESVTGEDSILSTVVDESVCCSVTDSHSIADDRDDGNICVNGRLYNITLTTILNHNSSNSMLDLSTNKVGGGSSILRTDLSTRSKKKIKVSIKQQFASTNKNYESNVLISSVTALSKKQTTNNKKK